MIKVVTEASSKVMCENQQDGYIRTKLHAQRKMPSFTSKKVHLKILDFSLYTMKLLIYFKGLGGFQKLKTGTFLLFFF